MTREIKFRCWHEKLNRMVYIESAYINSFGFEWIDEKRKSWELGWDGVMQYTGLKDKNGKEIYEGDIVKTDNYNGIHYFKVEIETHWQGYVFNFNCIDGEFSPVHCCVDECSEVIGNIYENPELV